MIIDRINAKTYRQKQIKEKATENEYLICLFGSEKFYGPCYIEALFG